MGKWLFAAMLAGLAGMAQGSVVRTALQAGIYEGGYVCGQGLTGLRLRVRQQAGGRQLAQFEFGGNDGLPVGAYLVAVRVEDDGAITLTPVRWVNRPRDYDMVGARLRQNGAELTGEITNPACGRVGLRRVN